MGSEILSWHSFARAVGLSLEKGRPHFGRDPVIVDFAVAQSGILHNPCQSESSLGCSPPVLIDNLLPSSLKTVLGYSQGSLQSPVLRHGFWQDGSHLGSWLANPSLEYASGLMAAPNKSVKHWPNVFGPLSQSMVPCQDTLNQKHPSNTTRASADRQLAGLSPRRSRDLQRTCQPQPQPWESFSTWTFPMSFSSRSDTDCMLTHTS